VIGNGSPRAAADFVRALDLTIPVFVDPRRTTYDAFAFSRGGLWTLLRPRTAAHLLRALRAGSRQGLVRGNPWQLGGVLVVAPPGTLLYRYASREAGDHPDPARILASLPRAPSLPSA
jgi:hypothetical protein